MQAARKGDTAKDAYKKQQTLQKGRSGVQTKNPFKKAKKKDLSKDLSIIEEESHPKKKNIPKKEEKKEEKKKPQLILEDSGEMMANSDSFNADKLLMKQQPEEIMPIVSDRPL